MSPLITLHNVATGEIKEREMNAKELAQLEADKVESEQQKAEAEAKATQKAALLDRLGITEDEAKLLLA
jgi:hypothetical protein